MQRDANLCTFLLDRCTRWQVLLSLSDLCGSSSPPSQPTPQHPSRLCNIPNISRSKQFVAKVITTCIANTSVSSRPASTVNKAGSVMLLEEFTELSLCLRHEYPAEALSQSVVISALSIITPLSLSSSSPIHNNLARQSFKLWESDSNFLYCSLRALCLMMRKTETMTTTNNTEGTTQPRRHSATGFSQADTRDGDN